MQEKRPWEARELFTTPLWRGVAEYRSGDFHAALQSFSQLDSAQAHYNRGNTLMHLGRTQEAITAYRQALQLEPDHGDASFNLEQVQRRIQQQPVLSLDAANQTTDQQQPEKEQSKKDSLYAEDLLDTPNSEELSQESGEAPEDLDKIGNLGGGAMLIPGAEQPEGPESPSIGQGLDDGVEMERESDRIARESRQAGNNQGGSEATTDTAQNRFVDPSKLETETEDSESAAESPERSSAAVAQNSDGSSPKSEQEHQELIDEGKGEPQDSANLTPELPAASTPAGEVNQEDKQAIRQWLNRIPESQFGLLKEKFLREYRRRSGRSHGGDPW